MDQSKLVMSIVFDNDMGAFSGMSKDECKLLMQSFPKLCKNNTAIMTECNIHSAKYWYERMHDNIVLLAIAKDTCEHTGDLQDKENSILFSVWSSDKEVQNIFRDLVIAEYKEYTYLEMWNKNSKIEMNILNEYERFVFEWYTYDDILNHKTSNVKKLYGDTKYFTE
jgi:hypothetical protein